MTQYEPEARTIERELLLLFANRINKILSRAGWPPLYTVYDLPDEVDELTEGWFRSLDYWMLRDGREVELSLRWMRPYTGDVVTQNENGTIDREGAPVMVTTMYGRQYRLVGRITVTSTTSLERIARHRHAVMHDLWRAVRRALS